MTDVLDILIALGILTLLAVTAVLFLGVVISSIWCIVIALRRYPRGFVRYTKDIGPRILVAIILQSAAGFALTDAPATLIIAASAGLYIWLFLLFSTIDAPAYTPSESEPSSQPI